MEEEKEYGMELLIEVFSKRVTSSWHQEIIKRLTFLDVVNVRLVCIKLHNLITLLYVTERVPTWRDLERHIRNRGENLSNSHLFDTAVDDVSGLRLVSSPTISVPYQWIGSEDSFPEKSRLFNAVQKGIIDVTGIIIDVHIHPSWKSFIENQVFNSIKDKVKTITCCCCTKDTDGYGSNVDNTFKVYREAISVLDWFNNVTCLYIETNEKIEGDHFSESVFKLTGFKKEKISSINRVVFFVRYSEREEGENIIKESRSEEERKHSNELIHHLLNSIFSVSLDRSDVMVTVSRAWSRDIGKVMDEEDDGEIYHLKYRYSSNGNGFKDTISATAQQVIDQILRQFWSPYTISMLSQNDIEPEEKGEFTVHSTPSQSSLFFEDPFEEYLRDEEIVIVSKILQDNVILYLKTLYNDHKKKGTSPEWWQLRFMAGENPYERSLFFMFSATNVVRHSFLSKIVDDKSDYVRDFVDKNSGVKYAPFVDMYGSNILHYILMSHFYKPEANQQERMISSVRNIINEVPDGVSMLNHKNKFGFSPADIWQFCDPVSYLQFSG